MKNFNIIAKKKKKNRQKIERSSGESGFKKEGRG